MIEGVRSMCTNIELFDEYTGKMLAELYQRFPVPVQLNVRKVSGHNKIDEYGQVLNESGDPSKEADIALATLEWLIESGYIKTRDVRDNYGFGRCVLTAKGLQVLKDSPDSLKEKKYLGDMLITAVKSGTTDSVKEITKLIISQGIKLAMG